MRKNGIKQDNRGFSLVEIIIVIAVMAILTGIIAPQVATYVEESRQAKDLQLVNSIFTVVQTAVALDNDQSIDKETIENTISKVRKVGELLGPDLITSGGIRLRAKSKMGTTGSLYVEFIHTTGELKVYIGSDKDTPTIGPVSNR